MSLTTYDKEFIEDIEREFSMLCKMIDKARTFNVGDYLIRYSPNYERKLVLDKTSYNTPRKFLVIHKDKLGLAYVKELNKLGKPMGGTLDCVASDNGDEEYHVDYQLDPDYADAVILDSKEDFDPVSAHLERSKIFKDIAAHNKKTRVKTWGDTKEVSKFLSTLKIGDVLWTSNTNWLKVELVDTTPVLPAKQDKVVVLVFTTSKGKRRELTIWNLRHSALYTAQPRTYKELRDPIL